jgi:hypothetical protein
VAFKLSDFGENFGDQPVTLDTFMDWPNVSTVAPFIPAICTLLSPLIALQVSGWLARRRDKYQRKFEVFQTLMRWRAVIFAEQPVQALNLIDVLYHDVRPVRDAWQELFVAFNDLRLSTPEGGRIRTDKIHKLLKAMADHLGYASEFSAADFERVYHPELLERFYANQIAQTNQSYEQTFPKQTPPATTPPRAASSNS